MADSTIPAAALPRIVMIDDEASNLQIVKIITKRENFQSDLVLFENGPDALEYLRDHSADLILLDLAMPDMNGFEVFARLKEDPATRDIPVIFLSAYQDTEHILQAFEMGATDFLAKPIISPILTARIRQIIHTRFLQKELQRSNEELIDTNRLKDELLSICSHDLRAPLSAIDLICQFLHESIAGASDRPQEELVNRIADQSRLARRLVDNLLGLNRIEEGRLAPSFSFFPVNELLQRCGEDEGPHMQAGSLEFRLDLAEGDPLCFGDREMVAQVMHNLLHNAARHARSSITVQARTSPGAGDGEDTLEIRVSDDGPGIPPDQQEQIFEKYSKLDRQSSGSGLGLYISRCMAELHNGALTVSSRPGQGSEFSLRLPHGFRPEVLPQLSGFSEARILIVPASRSQGDILEGLLLEGGLVHVEQAPTLDEMNTALGGGLPDLAVVDLQAAAQVSRLIDPTNGGNAATSWILLGAREQAGELEARLAGPNALLAPPFSPLRFLRQVHDFLAAHESAGQSATV